MTAGRHGKAGQGTTKKARQGKISTRQGNIRRRTGQDCKHKEIIKGANEEGNEERQVGQIDQ